MIMSVTNTRGEIILPSGVITPHDNVRFVTEQGSAGTLYFTADEHIKTGENVTFRYGGTDVFKGVVFKYEYGHEKLYKYTAYDMLRYFENKDTVEYVGMTASKLLLRIAKQYGFTTGEIEDTKYRIAARLEDGVSLYKIIDYALTLTSGAGFGEFVYYDDCGRLCLKRMTSLRCGTVMTPSVCTDFSITVSIDKNYYNKVKLVQTSGTGRHFFIREDMERIARDGVLQYYGRLSPQENGTSVAINLLNSLSTPKRSIVCTCTKGDLTARAGAVVTADFGDGAADYFCERAEHIFGSSYTMKLNLSAL
jgi:hypothetical protein